MLIIFKLNIKIQLIIIYSFNFANRKFLNLNFNKLHKQNRIKYISQFIKFD